MRQGLKLGWFLGVLTLAWKACLAKRKTPDEGPLQFADSGDAADKCTGPSVRKNRGPQDDRKWWRVLIAGAD